MYNLELSDLTPGRKYRVTVTASMPGRRDSQPSPVFEFTAEKDTVPPGPVTDLTFISEGDSFVAKWEKPTVNADLTPCTDFSHYIVEVADMTDMEGLVVARRMDQDNYTVTFDMNAEMFGTPKGHLGIRVRAVDLVGNMSDYVDAVAQNPIPLQVAGVGAVSGLETLTVNWDLNQETDIAGYEVFIGYNSDLTSSNGVRIGRVAPGTDNLSFTSFSTSPVYMTVVAIDKFNQRSIDSELVSAQPSLSTDFDKTPPGVVQDFGVTMRLSDDSSHAVASISYTGNTEGDLDRYDVQFKKTDDTSAPWSFRNIPADEESAEIFPLSIGTGYSFKIRAIDFLANKGPWSEVINVAGVAKTSSPPAVEGLSLIGGMTNIMAQWTRSTDPTMVNWGGTYEVNYSTASNFTDASTVVTSSTFVSILNLAQNTVYYVRVRAVDPYGNTGAWSSVKSENTGVIADPFDPGVYWSETEPADAVAGDTWFKLPENTPYRYDGTDWVKSQDIELVNALGNKTTYSETEPAGPNKDGDLWYKIDPVTDAITIMTWVANAWVDLSEHVTTRQGTDAQATADGKNNVFYSVLDPSGTNYTEGDTWFKRDAISDEIIGIWEFDGTWTQRTLTDSTISNLNAGTITAGFLSGARIAAGAIEADHIVSGGLDASTVITGGTITTGLITSGAITSDKIGANQISAGHIVVGGMDAATVIAPDSITTALIKANAIQAGHIDAGVIDADHIVSGGMDGGTVIQSGTISTDQIAANAITANKIAAGEIEGSHLKADTALVNNLNIASVLELETGGIIKSSNYNPNGSAGFYMDDQQLIINQGRIKAAAIELQDSANIMPPLYSQFNASASFYEQMEKSGLTPVRSAPSEGVGGSSPALEITSTGGSGKWVRFAKSATDNNIPVEPNQTYIISYYAKANGSASVQTRLYPLASGVVHTVPGDSTWRRYSTVATSNSSMYGASLVFYATIASGQKIFFDRIQIERKTGVNDDPSPYTRPGITSIEGEAISTGSIRSNATVSTSNGSKAKWSIDTAGNATFADALIDGKMIVAGGTVGSEDISIVSSNYIPGEAGWKIAGDGDVEFESGKFRGVVDLSKDSSGDEIPIHMSMSVSPIKVYTDGTNYSTIDTANITGTTYAYNRTPVDSESSIYVPTTANPEREGVFFIGPTTERSVNIQVHDSGESDSVFLESPPSNVVISSLAVGEQVDSASAPVIREDQGIEYRTERTEVKNYTFNGVNTSEDRNTVFNQGSSSISLRSPLYPEAELGENAAPSSRHEFVSRIQVNTPVGKNMLSSSAAVNGGTNATRRSTAGSRTTNNLSETGYGITRWRNTRRGLSRYFYNVVADSVTLNSSTEYVYSVSLDTKQLDDAVFVSAFLGSTQMTPIEPADPVELPVASDTRATAPFWWNFTGNNFDNHGTNANHSYDAPSPQIQLTNGYVQIASAKRLRLYGVPYESDGTLMENLSNSSGGTVAFWMRVRGGSTGDVIFHRASGTGSPPDKEFWITRRAGNSLQGGLKFSGSGKSWTATQTNLYSVTSSDSAWFHVAATMTGNSADRVLKIYVNGESIPVTFTGNTGSGNFGTKDFIYLGGNQQNDTNGFVGDFDDFVYYDRTLSDTEIEQLASLPRTDDIDRLGVPEKYTKVDPGIGEKRISFYASGLSAGSHHLGTMFGTYSGGDVITGKAQLEEAVYKNDTSLPPQIRNSHLPTLWSSGRVESTTEARLTLEASPVMDETDYRYSSGMTPVAASRLVKDGSGRSPASLVLNLETSYNGGDTSGSSSARYMFTPTGLVFPGTGVPFLPTAMTVDYDYSSVPNSSKSVSSGISRNLSIGPVAVPDQVIYTETFYTANDRKGVPSRWMTSGPEQAGGYWLVNPGGSTKLRIGGPNYNQPVLFGYYYSYMGQSLNTTDQDLSLTQSRRNYAFSHDTPVSGFVLSLNPQNGDRIVVRFAQNPGEWQIYKWLSGSKSTIASGTISNADTMGGRIRVVRNGNNIRLFFKGSQIHSGTYSNLPTGEHFGFVVHRGHIDDYVAVDSNTPSNPVATVSSNSINVNNNRGLAITPSASITTSAAGYYIITVEVSSLGNGFGNHFEEEHWITVNGNMISSRMSRYSGAGTKTYVATGVLFLNTGNQYIYLISTDNDTNHLGTARITIARVA